MRTEDLHDEICAALVKAGGISCDSILSKSATKADVFFPDHRTIVEVKTITTDRNKTDSVVKRAGEITHKHAATGGPVLFGSKKLNLAGLPRRLANDLLMNLGGRVRKEIVAANNQIKATAEALGVDPRGLLLLAVPAQFSTHEGVLLTVAGRVLKPGLFRGIDALIIMSAETDGYRSRRPLTFAYSPRATSRVPEELRDEIADAWFKHLSSKNGGQAVPVEDGSLAEFEARFIVPEQDDG